MERLGRREEFFGECWGAGREELPRPESFARIRILARKNLLEEGDCARIF
jgi:hypothetical protein